MFCIRLQMEGDDSDYFVEPRPGKPPAQVAFFEGVPRIGESVYLRSTSLVYKVLDVVYEPLVVAEGLEPRKTCPWTIVLILEDPEKNKIKDFFSTKNDKPGMELTSRRGLNLHEPQI